MKQMASKEKDKKSKQIDSQERAVLYSNNLLKAFESKAQEFNTSYEQNVTQKQIKSIYLSAVSKEQNPQIKNLYAFARINLFFDMIIGEETFVTGQCAQEDMKDTEVSELQFEFVDLKSANKPQSIETAIDFFEDNFIAEKHFSKAKEDLIEFDIDFEFFNAEEDLFLSEKDKNNYLWEIL
tara:strand:- start:41 stop:583 length:543 start_codon:yes stop_codon:yes gene_type:complete